MCAHYQYRNRRWWTHKCIVAFGQETWQGRGDTAAITMNSCTVLLSNYYFGVQFKKWRGRSLWHVRGHERCLQWRPNGKKTLRRSGRRWEGTIKMVMQEEGWGVMDWIDLSQDRNRWRALVNAVMNLRVPLNAGNFLTNWKPVIFSKRTLPHGVS